ncbi:MAG: PAS domain S-box protein, partial [Marmoricola sp.]|nr:PAS domain S-box protein [Marmoricola sp.]
MVGQISDYAIFALDPQGTIETWNLGAQRLKGYTARDAIGRNFAMFYTEQDRQEGLPARLLRRARDSGRVQHTGWRLRKDGSRFWGDVTITALRDSEGHLTGFAKITRDRSDIKALEEAQDSFYAAFNHDFRTPMYALKGFAEALREAPAETREQLIDRIEANSDRLIQMVDDLLEFLRHRAVDGTMLVNDIDVAQVVRDAVQQLGPDL